MTSIKESKELSNKICPSCGGDSFENVGGYCGTASPFNNIDSKLVECSSCSLVHMNPLPTDVEIDNFYENYWDEETSVQSTNSNSLIGYKAQNNSRIDFLLEQNISLDNKTVLDFGAGQGFFEEAIRKRDVKNCNYSAVEADLEMVETLKSRGIDVAPKIDTFDGKQFDVVVLFHVLEHLLDPNKVIEMLMKYVKPGGHLIIEVPNKDYVWKKNYQPHVVFFSEKSIASLFKKFSLGNLTILSCGRSLDILAKEKSFMKMQRHRVGKVLRSLGLKKNKAETGAVISEEFAHNKFEMDKYGNERQWLRVVAQKELN